MSLSCSCDEYEVDGDNWGYLMPSDFSKLETTRRKRCCSCKKLIDKGDIVLSFERFRGARSDIEERIWGDEVYLANWYMCECCGEIFLNLQEAGFCLDIADDMRKNLKEYHSLTGFIPEAA